MRITMYRCSRALLGFFVRRFFKIHLFGEENIPDPPYIITSNHFSYLDPPLVGMICRKDDVNFMAKKELFDSPAIGWWFRLVKCIPVKRGENSVSSLKASIGRLKDGWSVAIFPEGTRAEDGSIGEARRGIGFLIAKAKVPVVPVQVAGTEIAMPKGGKAKYGTDIYVRAGKPIMPEEFALNEPGKKDYAGISEKVMDRIKNIT
jgi:1-acyl-sn-glycerol-3-phosphate acyltransferase